MPYILLIEEKLRKCRLTIVPCVATVSIAKILYLSHTNNVRSRNSITHRQVERNALKAALQSNIGALCPILATTISYGIAYHHSGLTTDERRHLENAFRRNVLCIICCTSTLAMCSVNLPVKRVIIRAPYIGTNFLTQSLYKQIVGKAGRAELDECGESIIIFDSKDHNRMVQLLTGPVDEAASSLHLSNRKGLDSLILSAIGVGIATCLMDVQNLVSNTLLSVQAERLGVNVGQLVNQAVTELLNIKALTTSSNVQFENIVDPLYITQFGKASFKSGFDLQNSVVIYKDLQEAQKSLALLDHLHLLYVATPFEPVNSNIAIDMTVYYNMVR